MKYCGMTDIGRKRNSNQDSYAVYSGDGYFFAVVCDGMGGVHGGNIASGLGVKVFSAVIRNTFGKNPEAGRDAHSLQHILNTAVAEANSAIYSRAAGDTELDGMGTTLVAAVICECGAYAVNIGDSRIYCRTESGLFYQISKDHSFVQYLIDKGEITRSQAADHPNRNIILRALGVNETAMCDIFRIESYEMLLLCTDGLTNHIANERINEVISAEYTAAGRPIPIKSRVEKLISEANRNGGSDNITAILICRDRPQKRKECENEQV